jgi:polysaccharide export outer membrane protein
VFKIKYLTLFAALITFQSCLFYKDIVNFQDGYDLNESRFDSITNYSKWTIQPEDILMINVYSSNKEAAADFNIIDIRGGGMMMMGGMTGGSLQEPMIGYRVDTEGNIDMPIIGKVLVKGKSIEEVKKEIHALVEATGYLKDVNVQVNYLSFRITVLGEVNAPGSFILNTQKINVLEAIGLARDVNLFANRDNVLVIREKEGVRTYARLNLKSKDIFQSPYFYLQPNDIVYVEPHRAKVMAAPDPASRYTSAIVGVISLFTLIYSIAN